jgi:hypothetical protein
MQSLLQDIERIGKIYPLVYQRKNSTHAKAFFIPSGLSSKKTFDQWEKRGEGFDSMLDFISNGKKMKIIKIQWQPHIYCNI